MTEKSTEIWLFGYGSLIWRPDFPFRQRSVGTISGWSRRFWQGSHDHRGVPEAPGRVVTLVAEESAVCGGMAFRIDGGDAEDIFTKLDYREKNGYRRLQMDCTLESGEVVNAITYLAGPLNPAYLGDAPIDDIARQITSAHGPSGSNRDYLLELATALRQLGIDDQHVFALEERVQAMEDTR